MIESQANDFLAAAIRNYQQQIQVPPDDAKMSVTSYVAASVERYVAMDKAQTLEAFLDGCPQIDAESPN